MEKLVPVPKFWSRVSGHTEGSVRFLASFHTHIGCDSCEMKKSETVIVGAYWHRRNHHPPNHQHRVQRSDVLEMRMSHSVVLNLTIEPTRGLLYLLVNDLECIAQPALYRQQLRDIQRVGGVVREPQCCANSSYERASYWIRHVSERDE